jgi:hypothetical protein
MGRVCKRRSGWRAQPGWCAVSCAGCPGLIIHLAALLVGVTAPLIERISRKGEALGARE